MTYAEIEHIPVTAAERKAQRERDLAEGRRLVGGPECKPWCQFHDDAVCWSAEGGPFSAPVILTSGPDIGPRLQWAGAEEQTIDQAEAFARRLLDLVHEARKDTHVRVMVDSGDFWTPAWVPAEQSLEADR